VLTGYRERRLNGMDADLTTNEHRASLAIWGIGGPVAAGTAFTVTVGAKCHQGCSLTGQQVALTGPDGQVSASLGDTVWAGTGLYWAAVPLTMPQTSLGSQIWKARLEPVGLAPAHQPAGYSFSVSSVPALQHQLTVKFVGMPDARPLSRAHIRVGPYHALTDEEGTARLQVHSGSYAVAAWHRIHFPAQQDVTVDGDESVTITAELVPDTDPKYVPHHWG
jgi:hypothetical protein